jgi:hypothetical protein
MTDARSTPAPAAADASSRTGTYVLVIMVEVVTLGALWVLQQYYTL